MFEYVIAFFSSCENGKAIAFPPTDRIVSLLTILSVVPIFHHIRLVSRRLRRAQRVGWLVRACSDERSESDGPLDSSNGEMVKELTTGIIRTIPNTSVPTLGVV
jgi:hypothetical protein